jgi:hypothetical protein
MDWAKIFATAADALWQVLVVGLILGAGLPTLFALAVRSLNTNRTLVAAGPNGEEITKPSGLGLTVAVVCFAVCVAAVLFGIVVLVWGKQLFGV